MADYQPLISKAVAGLEKNTGEARRALYERARNALLTQLRGIVPALDESDITRERLALEEAIRKVEAESARKSRFDPPPERRRAEAVVKPAARPDAEPADAAPKAGNGAGTAEPPTAPTDLRRVPRKSTDDHAALLSEGLKGFRDVVADAENLGDATAQASKSARAAYAAVPSPSSEFERIEPHIEPEGLRSDDHRAPRDRDQRERGHDAAPRSDAVAKRERTRERLRETPRALAVPSDLASRVDGRHRDDFEMREPDYDPDAHSDAEDVRARQQHRAEFAQLEEEEEVAPALPLRPRRRIALLGALAVALLAVAGVVAWQWQPITGFVRGAVPPFKVSEPRDVAPTRQKITDRVGGDTAQESTTQPAAQVAQRVVLYEEDPQDPAGKRYVGSSVWRTESVSPGPNQPPEMVIRADIEIPERKMAMKWSLRRNNDKALPASHTVEIMFTLPPDFSHGGVQNIPGLLMKEAEQTRGVPLAGLAVKVTNGFFLIGLSAVESDMQRNIQLLKERRWFDVPIVYTDGRRAILAVEKGNPGERVFNDAFAAWKQ
jgi:hypothetical protein